MPHVVHHPTFEVFEAEVEPRLFGSGDAAGDTSDAGDPVGGAVCTCGADSAASLGDGAALRIPAGVFLGLTNSFEGREAEPVTDGNACNRLLQLERLITQDDDYEFPTPSAEIYLNEVRLPLRLHPPLLWWLVSSVKFIVGRVADSSCRSCSGRAGQCTTHFTARCSASSTPSWPGGGCARARSWSAGCNGTRSRWPAREWHAAQQTRAQPCLTRCATARTACNLLWQSQPRGERRDRRLSTRLGAAGEARGGLDVAPVAGGR